jgi:hypothetical protein
MICHLAAVMINICICSEISSKVIKGNLMICPWLCSTAHGLIQNRDPPQGISHETPAQPNLLLTTASKC